MERGFTLLTSILMVMHMFGLEMKTEAVACFKFQNKLRQGGYLSSHLPCNILRCKISSRVFTLQLLI